MFKITTLIENSSLRKDLAAEHGLSLLIEGEGFRLLYDTGGSGRFLQNAKTMGADLNGLDALALSHAHFDHTGGVYAYLAQCTPPKKIFIGRDFFDSRYKRRGAALLDIGPLIDEETLRNSGTELVTVGPECIKIAEGVWLMSGFLPREKAEMPSGRMVRTAHGKAGFGSGGDMGPGLTGQGAFFGVSKAESDISGEKALSDAHTEQREPLVQDDFRDEIAVVLDAGNDLCLISGCAHIGVVNMCTQAGETFGRPINMFLGGTHLMEADEQRVHATCGLLKKYGVKNLGACHCSGESACVYFEENFEGFFRNRTGSVVTVG